MSASVWEPGSSIINVNAETTNRSQVFGAYAGQTQFNLTDFTYTVGTESIAVYKNGQKLIRDVDFEEIDSDTVFLSNACEEGDVVEVVAIIGSTDANAQLAQEAVADCQAIRDSVANWPVVDHLSFSEAGSSDAVRKLTWNDTDGTLNLGLKGGNVVLQVGQEELVRIYNQTGSAFTDGQVLYITGSQGQRLTAGLARADAAVTSNSTIAVVTEPISNNAEGFATVSGLVRGLNTSAFNEGDTLYLSASTAGAITKVKPTAPNEVIRIGWCVRSHSSQGIIYVNVHHEVSVSGLITASGYTMGTGKILGRSSTGTGAIEELTQLPAIDGTLLTGLAKSSEFAASVAGNGYQKLPGGLIIQWGSDTVVSSKTITFPVAFPVACASVQGAVDFQGTPAGDEFPQVGSVTKTSFLANPRSMNYTFSGTFYWIAIGY